MSGGSLDYISYRLDEAASRVQRELAEIKLRYDHGKCLDVSDYDREEHPGAPELADGKAFTEAVMAQLQAALVCTRNAAVYLHEFEWWTSGDTGAADFLFSTREKVKGNNQDRGIV